MRRLPCIRVDVVVAMAVTSTLSFAIIYFLSSRKKQRYLEEDSHGHPSNFDINTGRYESEDDDMETNSSISEENKETKTVVFAVNEGQTVEGTVVSRQSLNDTSSIIKLAIEVDGEMKLLSFSFLPEEDTAPEVQPGSESLVFTDQDEVSIPGSSYLASGENLSSEHRQHSQKEENTTPENQGTDAEKMLKFDDSDAVILISPDDLALMKVLTNMIQVDLAEQLLHPHGDDDDVNISDLDSDDDGESSSNCLKGTGRSQ